MLALAAGIAQGAPVSCREEVGTARARDYAADCLRISPATHPPCNPDNPCAVIIAEILRGCRLDREVNGAAAADFCQAYLRAPEDRSGRASPR